MIEDFISGIVKSEYLKIIDLFHKYGSSSSTNFSLKSINLTIDQGEVVGLVGPSGCGKTTLLRIIAGFEAPLKGRILLSDKEISSSSSTLPPERRDVGMVFQDYALFPHLNVWKNICFGLRPGVDLNRARWLLDLLGLSELPKRYPHQLSGGQRQRVALARALAPSPSIILLDEPFNSLDSQVKDKLRNELSTVLRSCNATALFVTHDSSEALAICDKIVVMRYGEVIQMASPKKLVKNPATPFVGEFISRHNTLPICSSSEGFESPIGTFHIKETLENNNFEFIMFDPQCIELIKSEHPNSVVKSIEFYTNHYILTIKIDNFLLRVKVSLDSKFSIGESCFVSFKSNQDILLFPGSIQASLD